MIFRRLRTLLVCGLLALIGFPHAASAQSATSQWQALVYDPALNQLVSLNPNGIGAMLILPPQLAQIAQQAQADGGITPVAITADHHYVAVQLARASGLIFADLWTQTCCQPIANLPFNIDAISPAGFSPDGAYFAAAYVTTDHTGGFMMIDVTSNRVVETISADQFGAAFAVFALQAEWRADGVYFLPSCYACEPPIEGTLMRWDPYLNQVSTTSEYTTLRGDGLEATGEWVVPQEDKRFPTSGEGAAYFPPANVVDYFQGQPVNAVPVFFDAAHLDLGRPRWVQNGGAFLVSDTLSGTVVHRDGHQDTVRLPSGGQFLTATTDGWLMLAGDHSVLYYQQVPSGSGFTITTLAQFQGAVTLVESTPLTDPVRGGFPVVQPPGGQIQIPPTVQAVACPGSPPPRLVVNRAGRVTPGAPNNMRAQPTTSSPVAGVIPGGGMFQVLAGPVCADNLTWWRVNYNGIQGWTAEGQGAVYWVEPA